MTSTFFSLLSNLLISAPRGPEAYLDPGSGSYIIQLLLASLLGMIFLVRVYWKRITGFFSRHKHQDEVSVDEKGVDDENQ